MRVRSLISISPNLAKSTFGHGSKSSPPPKEAAAAPALAPFCITLFTKALTSSPVMRPLRPEPDTWPKSTPNSRASLRVDGPAWALAKLCSLIGVAPKGACGVVLVAAAGAGAAAGAAGVGAGVLLAAAGAAGAAAVAPLLATSTIRLPSDTLSPTLMCTAVTVPAAVAGTSMVALSVSSVIRVSSTATVSPTLISTAITSTLS